MEVFIEDIIIDNLIIDFIILFLTSKILNLSTTNLVLLFSAILGTIFTIINLFIKLTGLPLLAYKMLISVLMVLLICKTISPKKFLLTYLTFLLTTFIFAGLCFGICFSLGVNILENNGNAYYNLPLPMGIILGLIFIFTITFMKIVKIYKQKISSSNFIYDATLTYNKKSIKLKAYLDTGNTLCDPISNKPITFITYKQFHKLFTDISLPSLLLKNKNLNLENLHYVKTNTIGKSSEILVFSIPNLILKQKAKKHIISNAFLGLTFSDLDKKLDCGLLINPQIINGEFNE